LVSIDPQPKKDLAQFDTPRMRHLSRFGSFGHLYWHSTTLPETIAIFKIRLDKKVSPFAAGAGPPRKQQSAIRPDAVA
jgi:hypothetical protein